MNLNLCSIRMQIKKHWVEPCDALAEPNIQRRACWFNIWDCRAAPARHPLINLLSLLTVPLCSGQETIKIHANSWRSRGCGAFGIWKLCSLPGVDATGLAAMFMTFPGGLFCHRSGSEFVGTCKSTCLQCFHGWNLVRSDDLKVRPTQWSWHLKWFSESALSAVFWTTLHLIKSEPNMLRNRHLHWKGFQSCVHVRKVIRNSTYRPSW